LAEADDILISVEQKYVASMLVGSKTVELRRRPFRVPIGTRVWVYGKAPYATVAVVATVGRIVSASPSRLWGDYGSRAAITKADFDSYFSNARVAWAICLENICALPTAVTLSALRHHSAPFHPPQFFKKLHRGSNALNLLQNSLCIASHQS
jgi:predicted transcriptional regulator